MVRKVREQGSPSLFCGLTNYLQTYIRLYFKRALVVVVRAVFSGLVLFRSDHVVKGYPLYYFQICSLMYTCLVFGSNVEECGHLCMLKLVFHTICTCTCQKLHRSAPCSPDACFKDHSSCFCGLSEVPSSKVKNKQLTW